MGRIDFEILGVKGCKVKFGVLENQSESYKSPEKVQENFFLKKGTNPVNTI